MAGEKTNGYAVDTIENEGIGYAVMHYISGDEFKDPVTAALWSGSAKSLEALRDHLISETGREVDGVSA